MSIAELVEELYALGMIQGDNRSIIADHLSKRLPALTTSDLAEADYWEDRIMARQQFAADLIALRDKCRGETETGTAWDDGWVSAMKNVADKLDTLIASLTPLDTKETP